MDEAPLMQARVWEIVETTHICMFTTAGTKGIRARPLDARPDKANSKIYFLTDIRGSKDDEIAKDNRVCLIFIGEKAKAYLSVTGAAQVMRSDRLARKFWKKTDEVWWPGHTADPNLRIIEFVPVYAELWDGPADPRVARREFAKARASGTKPDLGEERKVVTPMEKIR